MTTFQWELYSNKLLRNSPIQELFLSEAFKFFKAHPETMTPESFENDWEEYYSPLFKVVYLFEEFIKKNDLRYLDEEKKTEVEVVRLDKGVFPLTHKLWSVRDTAKDKDAIEKTLLRNLPSYLSFIKGHNPDYKNGHFPDKWDESFLKSLMTDEVVSAFWKAITSPEKYCSYRARYMLAFSYFLNNPKLLKFIEPETDKGWWDINTNVYYKTNEGLRSVIVPIMNRQQEAEKVAENDAKAALKKILLKNQKKEDKVNFYCR